MKYGVYLAPDEDGGQPVLHCPGVFPRAETRAEAAENIREAIEGYLKSLWALFER